MRRSAQDQRAALCQVLALLRRGRICSRSALAKAIGASASTLGLQVTALMQAGLVIETGAAKGLAPGRPQRRLALAPQAGCFLGLEFNAQRIQTALLDFSGNLQATQQQGIAALAGRAQVLQALEQAITTALQTTRASLLAIGVAAPGLVDRDRGMAMRSSVIADWLAVPLAEKIRQRFGCAVTVENNLRVIALAERWFGAASELEHFAVLGPRSGLGMGVVSHGQLLRGAHHSAGEIGLWPWPGDKGNLTLQDELSATAIYRRLCGQEPSGHQAIALRDFFTSHPCSEWPETARQSIVGDFARLLRSVQVMMDLQCFFLHGPLTALGPEFCEAITACAATLPPRWPELTPPRLEPSSLGDEAGALGAATLAMEHWQPEV